MVHFGPILGSCLMCRRKRSKFGKSVKHPLLSDPANKVPRSKNELDIPTRSM